MVECGGASGRAGERAGGWAGASTTEPTLFSGTRTSHPNQRYRPSARPAQWTPLTEKSCSASTSTASYDSSEEDNILRLVRGGCRRFLGLSAVLG